MDVVSHTDRFIHDEAGLRSVQHAISEAVHYILAVSFKGSWCIQLSSNA
jgi:hypothetical protein